jgi:tetratricopeptide (TPR) repeat protein
MADEKKTGADWKKRESLGSAMVQIIGVGVVLFGAVFFLYQRNETKKKIDELFKRAAVEAQKGNPADLKKAAATVDEGLAVDAASPSLLSLGALINTTLWVDYKEGSAEGKAKEQLAKIKAADVQREDRFVAEAMQLVASGQAAQADEFIESLRKKGAGGPKLANAQARAQKGIGNLQLAAVAARAAADKAWKDANYQALVGEYVIEEGATGALDAFTKGTNANADHYRSRLGLASVRIVKRDRVGDAEGMVKDVLSHEAELSPWLKGRALALQAAIANIAEQPDVALGLANQAISANGDDPWALLAKANALALKKDPGAVAAYDAAAAKGPTMPLVYFDGAARLQKAGNLDAALALLNRYETLFKNVKNQTADGKESAYLDRDDKYWLARAEVLREAGKPDDAMAALDKAIAAKNVNLSKAYFAKGTLLIAKKEFDKAQEILLDITPPDGTGSIPEAYMAMGEVQFAKKAWGEGCQSYAYALSRFKLMQADREQLNGIVTDVEKKLKAAGQAPVAKVWLEESKPLIQ